MASADFCRLMLQHSRVPHFRLSQISPGKNADLHPMYLPDTPIHSPCSSRALFCFANSPECIGLLSDSCASGRDFASGFLQIPLRNGHPCLWLTLLAAKRVADSHRQVCAHAGRTKNTDPIDYQSIRSVKWILSILIRALRGCIFPDPDTLKGI
jgi:hypothetical protein